MTDRYIAVEGGLLVHVYALMGGPRTVAEVWARDPQAREHFYERRRIEGELYGRIGTRRAPRGEEGRVLQGENALAYSAIRQAGLRGRLSEGRAFVELEE
jgi:hypothetical protein